ncbi:hypothetical protein HMPREF3215_00313 [Staphylococcus simulans]|nr:hypothetical protein HMPREF3215_00313 [Staphylococcus simulans]
MLKAFFITIFSHISHILFKLFDFKLKKELIYFDEFNVIPI